MEVLTLNGQKYVKASKAARDLGYASDYVGQLCRKGAVDAHLVGRTWYVNPDTLGAHRVEKKRNARVKAREYARKTLQETTRSLQVVDTAKNYKNIDIRYETDEKELIPVVKKLNVETHLKKVVAEEEKSDVPYTIENANQKIIMSGSIPVHDAELEEQFTDTTILTPRIIRRKPTRPAVIQKEEPKVIPDPEPIQELQPLTFAEKIAAAQEIPIESEKGDTPEVEKGSKSHSPSSASAWPMVLGIIVCLCLAILSTFTAHRVSYSTASMQQSYELDSHSVYDFVAKYKDISGRLFK